MSQGTTKGVPIDVDPLLALDSDLVVPSQKAIKAYVDGKGDEYINVLGGTMIGNLILNADPLETLGAATKNYVDNFINGLDYKVAAHVGTVAALPAYTVSGSGQILTGNSVGAIPTATFDNHDPLIGERVLIKNETSTLTPNNGIYTVTQVGDGSLPFILTRAIDANTPANLSQATLNIIYGDTLANSQWHCSPAAFPIVIGTTYLTFVQVGSGVYAANAPITITGNIIAMPAAASGVDGYLSASDWSIFSGKQDAITDTLSLGTASTATGQLVFNNSTNANTLTLESGASSSSYTLTFPIAAPSGGQYLQFATGGVATWVNGTVNGVTTVGAFSASAQTNGATIASSTITFGPASATVPGMVSILAQTWAGAKTFTGAAVFSSATAASTYSVNLSGAGTLGTNNTGGGSQLYINGGVMQSIAFGATTGSPSITSRSAGTKLILYPNLIASSSTDFALGVNTNDIWISTGTVNNSISFYGAGTRFAYFTGTGLTLPLQGAVIDVLQSTTTTAAYLRWTTAPTGSPLPNATTRASGTRIILWDNFVTNTRGDYGIGYGSNETWIQAGDSGTGSITFYISATKMLAISNNLLTISNGVNIALNATTGTKIGTATTQKLSFWNKTPIVQPTTAITGATFVQVNTTTAVSTASTFGGYTLDKVVAALINTGILA